MNILLSGGCKNGKTTLAQNLAVALAGREGRPLYYLATMLPADEEDRERIRRHVADRAGLGFETLECGTDLLSALTRADAAGVFLVDSLTALLQNEMFSARGVDAGAGARCRAALVSFAGRVGGAVYVSDHIFSDAGVYEALTEQYRRALAETERAVAAVCDTVVELCAGTATVHKGAMPL